jgi:hypothetical protein
MPRRRGELVRDHEVELERVGLLLSGTSALPCWLRMHRNLRRSKP